MASTNTAESTARPRRTNSFQLILVDSNVHSTASENKNTLRYLRMVCGDVKLMDQPDGCIQFLERMPDKQSSVIVSGSFCEDLVPRIHDLPGLDSIYILSCNKQDHERWSRVWRKVRAVESDIKLIGDSLLKTVKQFKQDNIAMSIINLNDISASDVNRLEPSFLHSNLLKNAILSMDHNVEKEMATFKENNAKKSEQQTAKENLDRFQTEYRSDLAIDWYTHEYFLYSLINQALRNLEGDIIVELGFFINDLHRQLEGLYKEQLSTFGSEPFIVYRGQGLPKEKFEELKQSKGGLLSFNNFLSTSVDLAVSRAFAESNANAEGKVGVLFVITIDPKLKLTAFADVKAHTIYEEEREILFSMHTIFRIEDIRRSSGDPEIYEVQLVLTNDDDPQLKKLHDYMENHYEASGWHRVAWILQDMNQLDKAEEIYQRLLADEKDEMTRGRWNHHLGSIRHKQGDYTKAKQYFEKAFEEKRKVCTEDDVELAFTHNQLGLLYRDLGDYSQALSNFERAVDIRQKTSPDRHSNLATYYNNIGLVYMDMGNYPQAMSNYERALAIQQKILPDTHRHLANSYNNIGLLYSKMGDYPQSLSNHEQALSIYKRTLPDTDPLLATAYGNIGLVYSNMGDYSQALENYERAIAIEKTTLPDTHPYLAIAYHNIGRAYSAKGDHNQALSNLQRALAIRKKALPETHPYLAATYYFIGNVYSDMGDYHQALSNHEEALAIRKRTLPEADPLLITSYNSIGLVYYKMGDYFQALLNFEQALAIKQKTLPETHSDLAMSYNNIGLMYWNLGDYHQALLNYEKALAIQEKILPSTHPDLVTIYHNIGCSYHQTKEYSIALEYLEKALRIRESVLPADHPDTVSTRRWITDTQEEMSKL